MLVNILIGVAGLLVLVAAVAVTRPSAYHVERKLAAAAPADLVFGALNDLHQFAGVLVLFGSPLGKRDPNMQKTFEGPAAGVGQSFAWSGNKEVGKGKMTIEESVPGLFMDMDKMLDADIEKGLAQLEDRRRGQAAAIAAAAEKSPDLNGR